MQSYRSIFLSDMHLGYRGCQAALLFDFLHTDGVLYANCGDWIENCTALAETHTGELVLLDWKARTVVNAAIPLREMGYLSVAKAGG